MSVIKAARNGLDQAQALLERTAQRLARSPGAAGQVPPEDRVDLSAEMIHLLETRNYYRLHTRVLKTAFQMQEHLLDVLG